MLMMCVYIRKKSYVPCLMIIFNVFDFVIWVLLHLVKYECVNVISLQGFGYVMVCVIVLYINYSLLWCVGVILSVIFFLCHGF